MGTLYPKLGCKYPNLGTVYPNLGTIYPILGYSVPQFGVHLPQIGVHCPQIGVHCPQIGVTDRTVIGLTVVYCAERPYSFAMPLSVLCLLPASQGLMVPACFEKSHSSRLANMPQWTYGFSFSQLLSLNARTPKLIFFFINGVLGAVLYLATIFTKNGSFSLKMVGFTGGQKLHIFTYFIFSEITPKYVNM